MATSSATSILTIGHSTRSIADFVVLLQSHSIELLADVRTVPRSRMNPQFNSDALPATLVESGGIRYTHLPGLGGLRHPRADSPNNGWKNRSFRGYADYMQTQEFEQALGELRELATQHRTCIMCAEAVPWRCHRSLVADALLARGVAAYHILNTSPPKPHTLTSFASVQNGRVTYPLDARQMRLGDP